MKVSRRDLLAWGAGAAAGLVVTPVPWKLLDDTSIWTQNWKRIPQPSRGPVELKHSACTLCPNGCGLRVRTAGGWPVGVAGSASHPVTRGALCPLGFGAHQLNWHPERLRMVRHRGVAGSWNDARAAFAKACGEGPVVVIDGYPGRAASVVMETFANKRGEYRVLQGAESRALATYEQWSGVPASDLGYDLESTRTILSFGVPLLDGWGVPGRFTHLWAEHAAGQLEPELRIIQIEDSLSRTATRAWRWIAVRRGSEGALASGIARVLLEDRLVSTRVSQPDATVSEVALRTGLDVSEIRELARTIVAQSPAVAIANGDVASIAALNVVLGAVGARGGIVRRSRAAKSFQNAETPISSARAVVLDASVPWNFVPKTDAQVFRFAAWNGGPSTADWLLPAPGFLEESTDVPTAPTLSVETYAIASAIAQSPHITHSCAEFLASVDPSLTSAEKVIHKRCAELYRSRVGVLHSGQEIPVAKLESVSRLEEQLWNGAVLVGEPASGEIRCALKQWPADDVDSPFDALASWSVPVMPALATKLYQESGLRESQGRNA
jgi:anaerobic selenocysteine-containing dehydrogenase